MQVFIETVSQLKRRARVSVPDEQISQAVHARLQKVASTHQMKGFRRGKVPFGVVKQRFGAQVHQEVVAEQIRESFTSMIEQEQLRLASRPHVELKADEQGKPLEYIADFEVLPDIENKDYSQLKIVVPVAEVTEADIDKMLALFRDQQATWKTVDRASEEGDQVAIDFNGSFLGEKEGQSFPGGSAKGMELVLGEGRMIPGFEEGIVGMRAGEEKVIPLTFPEEYHVTDLKGADVQFVINVSRVAEKKLAEVDEALFTAYGMKGADEALFRQKIGENMTRELQNATKAKVKQQVMDALLELYQYLPVPQMLVQHEIHTLRSQMEERMGRTAKWDKDTLFADELFEKQAQRQVKLSLLMNHFVAKEHLKPDPDRVKVVIEDIAATYENPEQVISFYYTDPTAKQKVESLVLDEMVIDRLVDQMQLKESAASYDEVMAPESLVGSE